VAIVSNWGAYVGAVAAFLSSLSYVPQVRKAWPRGSTADLSLTMLVVLTCGLLLWIVYGVICGDWVIVAANGVGAGLSGLVLAFKIRDLSRGLITK
jgi:MtN3 and saliva related transmembrane protein